MPDIKDIFGVEAVSRSIEKFTTFMLEGFSTLALPIKARLKAKAKRIEITEGAKTEQQRQVIEFTTEKRMKQLRNNPTLLHSPMVTENIVSITNKAIGYLPEKVSDTPVDPDWRTRWFRKAGDISNEEMQEVWAKILASEVAEPGTFSLRTLETVSNLSKHEAEVFQKVCNFVSNSMWIQVYNDSQHYLEKFGLIYYELLELEEAGLLRSQISYFQIKFGQLKKDEVNYTLGTKFYQAFDISNDSKRETYPIQIMILTKSGQELCQILEANLNPDYKKTILEVLKEDDIELTEIPNNQ